MLSDLMERFEKASATYAAANGVERDEPWFLLKLLEEAGSWFKRQTASAVAVAKGHERRRNAPTARR